MKIQRLIMLILLATGVLATMDAGAAVKVIDEETAKVTKKRDLLTHKGYRFGRHAMTTYCTYEDHMGNTVLIPDSNFKHFKCAKYVAKR